MTRKIETSLLVTELKKCYEQGKIAHYSDLEKIVTGCSTVSRTFLTSALKIVQNEYGYIFKCVTSVGYKPIINNKKVDIIEQNRINKIKSQVNKFESELNCVNVSELSNYEQQRYYSAQIRLSCHQMVLDNKLDSVYKVAGEKCANSGKIEFNPSDFQDALKALA